jgi:hypothetical protein
MSGCQAAASPTLLAVKCADRFMEVNLAIAIPPVGGANLPRP